MKINITTCFNHNNASVIRAFIKSPAVMIMGMAFTIEMAQQGHGSFYNQTNSSSSNSFQSSIAQISSKSSHGIKLSILNLNP